MLRLFHMKRHSKISQHKKRYYIIGIAGVAMGNLAGLLKQKGHEVAGSDQEVYEPIKSMLAKEKISVFTPYSAFHVKRWRPDVVVVGNAISRGNPELEWTLSNGQIYRSVSDILMDEFVENSMFHEKHIKQSIVITGTHGKTTTSALVAWILEIAGLDPTVFVGGAIKGFPPGVSPIRNAVSNGVSTHLIDAKAVGCGFKYGKGKYVVLEGDEYDTAFFDKNPKFLHYRPFFGLLNNIELDHIDIYQNLDHIRAAFKSFMKLIPQNGVLAVNSEDKNAWGLVQECLKSKALWKNNSEPKIISFGTNKGDFQAKNVSYNLDSSIHHLSFDVFHLKHKIMRVNTQLSGKHNVSNILGAIAITREVGVSCETIRKGIATFAGVKRRMEIIGEKSGVTVVDDYAHHPTAVLETINAVRQRFHVKPHRAQRIVAVFEPGSASSRRKVFEREYINSLGKADVSLIYKPFKAGQINPVRNSRVVFESTQELNPAGNQRRKRQDIISNGIKKSESFSGRSVSREINRCGGKSYFCDDLDKLMLHVKTIARAGDILLIMSCRGFDGLREKIMGIL